MSKTTEELQQELDIMKRRHHDLQRESETMKAKVMRPHSLQLLQFCV